MLTKIIAGVSFGIGCPVAVAVLIFVLYEYFTRLRGLMANPGQVSNPELIGCAIAVEIVLGLAAILAACIGVLGWFTFQGFDWARYSLMIAYLGATLVLWYLCALIWEPIEKRWLPIWNRSGQPPNWFFVLGSCPTIAAAIILFLGW